MTDDSRKQLSSARSASPNRDYTTPPMKPSEKIAQMADHMRPLVKGTPLETSEAELRLSCVIAYLDEREAAAPVAEADTACDGPELTPCKRCLAPHEANDGIGGKTCGRCLDLDEALAKLATSEARCKELEAKLALEATRVTMQSDAADMREDDLERLRVEVAELREELAKWQEFYAKRGAVVQAARSFLLALEHGGAADQEPAVQRIATALSTLDATSHIEPDGGREIVVGSKWRHVWGFPLGALGLRTVEDVDTYGLGHIRLNGISGTWGDNFRNEWEWVSDPPTVSESATGEGER